jgi:hypothetical protein
MVKCFFIVFCPSFSKEGGPLAVGDFFRLKILRLYEPPPLSKGGQKGAQNEQNFTPTSLLI